MKYLKAYKYMKHIFEAYEIYEVSKGKESWLIQLILKCINPQNLRLGIS